MGMRPAFRQTEAGMIPYDWVVKPLAALASLYQPTTISAKGFTEAGFPVYGANGIVGFYDKSNHNTWQVTVTCRGSTCGTVNWTVDRCWITGNAMVLNCDQNTALSKEFFYHLLCGQDLSDCITGTGQPQIVRSPLAAFCVSLPPTKAEQDAIAKALSDADGLIESLEQLLAKKRHLRRGVTQELLTGRRRLLGFGLGASYKDTEAGLIPNDWDIDYVESLAFITTGGRNTQDRIDDGLYPFFVRSQNIERINSYSFDGEAVLTAGDGVGTGKVFHYVNGKFDAHQRVYRISDFSERMGGYFFYLYFSSHFYNRIMQMTAKSSVDLVRREMIARMLIPFPQSKAEQDAIAEAVNDMEAEITAHEAKLAKARDIKLGMMQELLTGRIRLV